MMALTNCMPAVTRRLPMTRLARAVMTSRVPHDKAAARPVRSPKGIGPAYEARLTGRTVVAHAAPEVAPRPDDPEPAGRPGVAC